MLTGQPPANFDAWGKWHARIYAHQSSEADKGRYAGHLKSPEPETMLLYVTLKAFSLFVTLRARE